MHRPIFLMRRGNAEVAREGRGGKIGTIGSALPDLHAAAERAMQNGAMHACRLLGPCRLYLVACTSAARTTDDLQKNVLKGMRWLLLKNSGHRADERGARRRLEEALRLNHDLATASHPETVYPSCNHSGVRLGETDRGEGTNEQSMCRSLPTTPPPLPRRGRIPKGRVWCNRQRPLAPSYFHLAQH